MEFILVIAPLPEDAGYELPLPIYLTQQQWGLPVGKPLV